MTDSNSSDELRGQTRTSLDRLRAELLAEREAGGHWVGELSPSSLSTATAVSAISAVLLDVSAPADAKGLRHLVSRGIDYLRSQQNVDGGFGDTDRSHSNIATSYLVLAAASLSEQSIGRGLASEQVEKLQQYIRQSGEIEGLRRRYGKDKTFVVPILTNLAIAGLVDWSEVSSLPFEAAVFPQSMYRFLGMPVVSYAVPALVAIGQARHFRGPRAFLPLRLMRSASVGRTLKVLRRMQPESGGYLEATPLTAFVVMSLAATGRGDLEVSQAGLRFLKESMTEEGSWPIDTNLATWVTSLAIHGLACDPDDDGSWCQPSLVDWHLGCQHLRRHPFTGAEPGGWGWSDLSGAVPDSDDTPAAILALRQIARWSDAATKKKIDVAVERGRGWLLKLQNRDGGWPTFCRGWGKLPFDRSSTDLTAHAVRALRCGDGERDGSFDGATDRARRFLEREQQDDGSWLPLWFGNQDREDDSNPVYGTARVLLSADQVGMDEETRRRGCEYLISCQNEDGGWGGGPSVRTWLESTAADAAEPVPDGEFNESGPGGPAPAVISSVEETALAVDALTTVLQGQRNLIATVGVESEPSSPAPFGAKSDNLVTGSAGGGTNPSQVAIIRGVQFLLGSVDDGRHRVPWPIGFYFAKLWYHERLYPLIFTVTALGKYLQATANENDSDRPRNEM